MLDSMNPALNGSTGVVAHKYVVWNRLVTFVDSKQSVTRRDVRGGEKKKKKHVNVSADIVNLKVILKPADDIYT